jgi:1,5-anhydro-D-fructose reductase (1,5-anhydro-D-mannitol-forming)
MNFGIVGFGVFAEKRLIPGFNASRSKIQAIFKTDIQAAEEKAVQYDIPAYYNDPSKLVHDNDVEAVYIATPNKYHTDHVLLSASAGKPIICEKPLATSYMDARRIAACIKETGIPFMVGQCYRYSGSVRCIKNLIDQGTLGEVKLIRAHFSFNAEASTRNWIFDKDLAGGGAVFDVGVHLVDLVRFLLDGEFPCEINAVTRKYDVALSRSVEAGGNAVLVFGSGVVAMLSCSFETPYLTTLEVQGTERWLTADYWNVLDHDVSVDVYSDKKLGEPEQSFSINNENFYAKMIDAFADRVENGSEPIGYPGIVDGVVNQKIIDEWIANTRMHHR